MKANVEIDNTLSNAYQHFNEEEKQATQKPALKERLTKLKKSIAELQNDPGCNCDPEIIYMFACGENY